MEAEKAKAAAEKASETQGSPDSSQQQQGSPQSVLEEMSLQQSMDKNKESLKRKLMMRRSVNELVDQGIYPPLKTPPSYAEQRKHLERAKTGDILRHKIQHRPDRNFLVQQHILEDTNIDRSLHERQRLLKRARLADNLNDKLLRRPGPLELLHGNILQADGSQTWLPAVQDGVLGFNKSGMEEDSDQSTSLNFEEDSNHSDVALSPQQCDDGSIADIGSPPVPSAPDLPKTFQTPIFKHSQVQTGNLVSKVAPLTTSTFSITSSGLKNGNSSAGKVRQKKPKPKTQSKAKIIKFHEYKGPPNIVKTATPVTVPQPDSETPYNMLLQQQQLFLQWQVKLQQDNLNVPILLPTQNVDMEGQSNNGLVVAPAGSTLSNPDGSSPPPPGTTIIHTQGSIPQSVIATPQTTLSPGKPTLATTQSITRQSSPQLLAQPQPQITIPQSLSPTSVSMSSPPTPAPILSPPTPVPMLSPQTPTPILSPPTPAPILSPPTPAPILSPPTPTRVPTPQHIIQPPPTPMIQTQTVIPVAQPQVQLPTNKVHKSHSSSSLSKNHRHSNNSSSNPNKPLSNLEDMKVAALKAELKKRNLPVSGTKTALIERLRPYEDVITGSASGSVNINENLVAQVQPMPPAKTIVTVKPMMHEKKLVPATPPMSPVQMELMAPLSPENDTTPAQNITLGIYSGLSQNSVLMSADQSRPPSTAPADMPMEVDSMMSDSKVPLKLKTTVLTSSQVPTTVSPVPTPTPPLSSPQTPNPQMVSHLVTQDELLLQHQKKIEMLQKQLEESQLRLQLQQLQHQQLQQQQHQLKQQQQELQDIQKEVTPQQIFPEPNLPSQIVNTIQITMPAENKKTSPTQLNNSNSKQIQMPTHLLQTSDNSQGIPVIVQTTSSDSEKQTKPNLDFFKLPSLQQSTNAITKSSGSLTTVPNIHHFTIATTSGKTASLAQLNGITQNRTASLPGSPVEAPQGLTRTVSNPYFIPLKEPPKYDEAMKSKQQNGGMTQISHSSSSGSGSGSSSGSKPSSSQTMDDVLEILIRNGELPASASWVPESPIPPKSVSQPKSIHSSAISSHLPSDMFFSFSTVSPAMTNTLTTSVLQDSLLSTSPSSYVKIKQEPASPPPVVVSVVVSEPSELLGMNDVLNQDLSSMDWASDPTFTSMDLNDGPGLSSELDLKAGPLDDRTLLNIPTSSGCHLNNRGSEPDLAGLGLNDTDAPMNMQVDISDWLDVHLPPTGLTPLSATAPVSFPSDPILTPKTQQEVLDLFNFDDVEFNTSADLQSGINWDRFTETAKSSS